MIAVRIRHTDEVTQVEDGVTSHVRGIDRRFAFAMAGLAFQPKLRTEAPIGREVLSDLAIDGTTRTLQFRLGHGSIRHVDYRDDHGLPPSVVRTRNEPAPGIIRLSVGKNEFLRSCDFVFVEYQQNPCEALRFLEQEPDR